MTCMGIFPHRIIFLKAPYLHNPALSTFGLVHFMKSLIFLQQFAITIISCFW